MSLNSTCLYPQTRYPVDTVTFRPRIIGLFLGYFVAILACLLALKWRIKLARIALWLYDHVTRFHTLKLTRGWDKSIIRWMDHLKTKPICVWVKNDDVSGVSSLKEKRCMNYYIVQIYNLVEAILYVRRNELTARIIFLHAYDTVEDIPTELEANVKILDEAFPVCCQASPRDRCLIRFILQSITLDLIFIKGTFNPIVSYESLRVEEARANHILPACRSRKRQNSSAEKSNVHEHDECRSRIYPC